MFETVPRVRMHSNAVNRGQYIAAVRTLLFISRLYTDNLYG